MVSALLAFLLMLTAAGAPPAAAPSKGSPGASARSPAPAAPEWPAAAEELRVYRVSGAWRRDIALQVARAKAALTFGLMERRTGRPALVLDVDDTALSTYPCLERVDFDRSAARCGRRRDLPAIAPTRALARLAQRRGVELHFITGRPEMLRRSTVANLRRAGYTGRWRLHMRPDGQPPRLRDGWKARTRRGLVRDGRVILVNVGDQRSDLTGGWARNAVKLPNPMYEIPVA